MDDAHRGGKRGRRVAGKQPFVAAVETTADRKPRRLRLSVVKGFRKREVERIAKRDFAPKSNITCAMIRRWITIMPLCELCHSVISASSVFSG